MERKSMGEFIAALRKASGMTQKELAEKLNVSDKTISRWERDDGAPDISAIPVIAEIFGVTCDELLRGERKTHDAPEEPTPKGEKQRQRLIGISLSKYRTRTIVANALYLGGLIVAMILNNGFLRAQIGFLSGLAIIGVGVVLQMIAMNQAMFAVSDSDSADEKIAGYKRSVIRMAEASCAAGFVLFGVISPLAFVEDAHWGLEAEAWMISGFVHGAFGALIALFAVWNVDNRLFEKGVFTLEEKEAARYRKNHALQKYCSSALIAALVLTFVVQLLANDRWTPARLADGIQFDTYESFAEFMEKPVPYKKHTANTGNTAIADVPILGDTIYYDDQGNEISEEEFYRRELTLHDGTVVCEYVHRNESVSTFSYMEREGSLLPITVVTYDDLAVGRVRSNAMNMRFYAAYCIEAAIAFAVYFLKRER